MSFIALILYVRVDGFSIFNFQKISLMFLNTVKSIKTIVSSLFTNSTFNL